MALFYSATRGFLDDQLHADLPADARPITPARHRELLDAQATGASIVAAGNGRPQVRRASLDDRRAAAVRGVRKQAACRITAIAPIWRQLNDQRDPSTAGQARFVAIDAIRAASDQIEALIVAADADALEAIDIANHPLWPKD